MSYMVHLLWHPLHYIVRMYSYKQFTEGNCRYLNSVVIGVYHHSALGSHLWTERRVQRTTWLSSLSPSLSCMLCPLPATLNNASRACVQSQLGTCLRVTKAQRITARQSEHSSAEFPQQPQPLVTHSLAHTHVTSPSPLAYLSICLHGGTPSQNERHV